MKCFLTGGTGFIGGRIARQLRQAGHEVVALVRSPAKAADLETLGAVLHAGDITDKESMRGGMTGADAVIHTAAWYKIGVRDRTAYSINVDGTRNVLELMRELHIPRGVYTSTVGVFSDTEGKLVDENYRFDGKHLSEYDRTKWLAHYEIALPMMAAGLPLIVVQPALTYGPGDHSRVRDTFVQFLQGKLPLVPRRAAHCWGHVDDVARGHLLALEKGVSGQCYIIAGPPHSLVEALEMAERITGIKAPRRRLSPTTLKVMAN